MWTYFYKSKKIKDLALSIDPKLEDEIIQFIENEDTMNAEAEASTSNVLSSLIKLKAKGELGSKYKKSNQIKKSYSESAITRTFENFLTPDKYSIINSDTTIQELKKLKKIIKIDGFFKMCINGKTPNERINNFDDSPFVSWVGQYNDFVVTFITNRESFTIDSRIPTPVLSCLSSSSKKIRLDGIGILETFVKAKVTISPILLGTYLDI